MSSSNLIAGAPVVQSERIIILDALRGIAILGILLMNIPGFGLPEIQASDPSIYNETGINYKIWYAIDWIFSGTQRAFFSMLFGAGMILFISRLEKRMEGMMPAIYFFRRQMWLMAFGLFNAFVLLWFWDILFHYALCGMMLFVFYRLPAKTLLVLSFVSLVLMTVRDNKNLYDNKNIISKGEVVARIDTTVSKLTALQRDELDEMTGFREKSSHESKLKIAEKEIMYMTGNYASVYKVQSEKSAHVHMYYVYFGLWDVLIFMFLGMAFYKNGVLLGNAPSKLYWLLFIGGLGLGLLLSYVSIEHIIQNKFSRFEFAKNVSFDPYQLARMLRSLGFFGFVMLLFKSGAFKWFFNLFRPVGQMAFTNYLMQSLIGAIFFYGCGLGYFGKLERHELYIYVAIVWAIEIIWSHIWLKNFRFGPLEWAWRSLTYWKIQPIKKGEPNTDTAGLV
jgi:uncharacterized protein